MCMQNHPSHKSRVKRFEVHLRSRDEFAPEFWTYSYRTPSGLVTQVRYWLPNNSRMLHDCRQVYLTFANFTYAAAVSRSPRRLIAMHLDFTGGPSHTPSSFRYGALGLDHSQLSWLATGQVVVGGVGSCVNNKQNRKMQH